MTSVFVADTPDAAAEAAADRLTAAIAAAKEARGAAHIAIAGGTTPRKTYELLASRIDDWTGVEVWFGDERAVGPDDPESNFRMASETLLADGAGPEVRYQAVSALVQALSLPAYHVSEAFQLIQRLQPSPRGGRRRK